MTLPVTREETDQERLARQQREQDDANRRRRFELELKQLKQPEQFTERDWRELQDLEQRTALRPPPTIPRVPVTPLAVEQLTPAKPLEPAPPTARVSRPSTGLPVTVIPESIDSTEIIQRAGEAIQRLRPGRVKEGVEPRQALAELALEGATDSEEFLKILRGLHQEPLPDVFAQRQRQSDVETIFQALAGATVEEAKRFFAPTAQELLTTIFPRIPIEELVAEAESHPDRFIQRLQLAGRTKQTQDLLRLMGLSWQEVGQVFATEKTFLAVEGVQRFVTVLDNNMVLDQKGIEIGRINPATQAFEKYQYRIGDTWKSFTAGTGMLIATGGAAAKWMGAEGIGETLSEFGGFLEAQAPVDTLGEFSWQQLYNPVWWGTKYIQAMPFTLALVPAMLTGAAAGGATAATLGLGRTGTFIAKALGATAMSRPMESALEAGAAYDEALTRGMSKVEARQVADKVFSQNLALAGSDFSQLALAFAPTPTRVFSNLMSRGWVKTGMVAGRLTLTGLSEGGEEVVQNALKDMAMGKEVKWDAEMREAFALGGIMGIGLGVAGTAYSSIKQRTISALSPDLKVQFDTAKATALAEGLKEERADERGLEAVSGNKEVQDIIAAVVEQVKIDALELEIQPQSTVDKLVWEQAFAKMRELAPQVPGEEAAAATLEALGKPQVAGAAARKLTRPEAVNLADLRKQLSMPGGLNDRDYALLQRLEARQAAPAVPIRKMTWGELAKVPHSTDEKGQDMVWGKLSDAQFAARQFRNQAGGKATEVVRITDSEKPTWALVQPSPSAPTVKAPFDIFQDENRLWFVRDNQTGVTSGSYRSKDVAERFVAKALEGEIANAKLVQRQTYLEEASVASKLAAKERAAAIQPTKTEAVVPDVVSKEQSADIGRQRLLEIDQQARRQALAAGQAEMPVVEALGPAAKAAQATEGGAAIARQTPGRRLGAELREFTEGIERPAQEAERLKNTGDAIRFVDTDGTLTSVKVVETDVQPGLYTAGIRLRTAGGKEFVVEAEELPELLGPLASQFRARLRDAELDLRTISRPGLATPQRMISEAQARLDRIRQKMPFDIVPTTPSAAAQGLPPPGAAAPRAEGPPAVPQAAPEVPQAVAIEEALGPLATEEERQAFLAAGGPSGPPPVTPPVVEAAPEPEPGTGATPVERVMSHISFKPRTLGIGQRVRAFGTRFLADWVNDLHSLDKVLAEAQRGGLDISLEENPAIQAHLLKGVIGKAQAFLSEGTFGRQYWKIEKGRTVPNLTGESLQSILQEVSGEADWKALSTYLVSRHAVELADKSIASGIPLDDVVAALKVLDAEHPDFTGLARRLDQYQERLLSYAVDGNILSQELSTRFRTKYGKYVPFYRVMEDLHSKGFMGKKMANIATPFRRIRGSERDIINPLESIVKNTYAIITAADANMVGVQLANLVDKSPEISAVFERVRTPTAPVAKVSAKELGLDMEGISDEDAEALVDIFRPAFITPGDEVTVLIDGKKQYYRVEPFLRRALLHVDARMEDMGIVGTILSAPAKWLRAGALLSPDFMVRNPTRDQLTAFAYAKYGYLPGIDVIKGAASMVKADADRQLYKMSGAEHATMVSMDRDYLKSSFQAIMRQNKFTNYIKSPVELLRLGRDLSETATRLGAAKRAMDAGASGPEVGYTGRNITLDFQTAGAYARVVNRYIPFWTAAIRGNAMMIEMFKAHPVRTSLRVFLSITMPSIALYLLNRDDPRWKEIQQWQKDLFWIIFVPGQDEPVKIPKPFELGVLFGSGPERFLEWLDTKDSKKLKDLADTAFQVASPGFIPQAALPFIENLTNFSIFRGTKIVPASREDMPPELQYTAWTSETSKKLGELLQYPPAKIDNLINGWTGGLGRYAVNGLDGILKKTGIAPDIPEPSPTLADRPVIKAFVVRSPYGSSGQTVEEFYDTLERYQGGEKYLKEMLTLGEQAKFEKYKAQHPELLFFLDFEKGEHYSASARYLRTVARELTEIRKKQDAVYQTRNMTPDEKRKLIDQMDRLKTEVARRALDLFLGEQPEVLQHILREADQKLGDVLDETPLLSREPDKIYDITKLRADYRQTLQGVSREDIALLKGIPQTVGSFFDEQENEQAQNALPNMPIHKINADPEKGDTFEDYALQWQHLQSITDPQEQATWLQDHPRAYLGNLTKRQLELLRKFHAADETAQARMLRDNPELKVDLRDTWLRENPLQNARLALWGQAKILTQESYDEFQKLKKELDIPDSVLPTFTLPPEASVATHFTYQEYVSAGTYGSWEAQLLLAKDSAYREWAGLAPSDTPTAALELLVADRTLYDEERRLRDTLPSVEDQRARNYRQGYQYAIAQLKAKNPQWVANQRRIEALRWGSDEEPTPAKIVQAHVNYGKLVDVYGAGSAEVLLWRASDRSGYAGMRPELQPIDKTRIPIWRIDVKYRREDAAYDALPTTGEARANFLANNDSYRQDRRRREAYQLAVPTARIEEHVALTELPIKGFRRERWLREHPDYYTEVWLKEDMLGNSAVDFSRVPDVKYDELYEKWEAQFERLEREIPAEVRLLTGEARNRQERQLRDALFQNNPGFLEASLRREAYGRFVPESAVRGFVAYGKVLYEGKPAGWDEWWADDRVLRDNPLFFEFAQDQWGWEDRDFSAIPSVAFERTYNEEYITLRRLDGSADRTARATYRAEHPSFDAEGVKAGLWLPYEAPAAPAVTATTTRPTRMVTRRTPPRATSTEQSIADLARELALR